jgi:hypothetical protein
MSQYLNWNNGAAQGHSGASFAVWPISKENWAFSMKPRKGARLMVAGFVDERAAKVAAEKMDRAAVRKEVTV